MKGLIEKRYGCKVQWVEKTGLLILIGWMVKNQKQLSGGVL